MLWMVVEHFREGRAPDVYRRFRDRGRLAPEGLTYVSSWVDFEYRRCFQVMEAPDEALLRRWIANWDARWALQKLRRTRQRLRAGRRRRGHHSETAVAGVGGRRSHLRAHTRNGGQPGRPHGGHLHAKPNLTRGKYRRGVAVG